MKEELGCVGRVGDRERIWNSATEGNGQVCTDQRQKPEPVVGQEPQAGWKEVGLRCELSPAKKSVFKNVRKWLCWSGSTRCRNTDFRDLVATVLVVAEMRLKE